MAYITQIEEHEAEGKLKEIFAQISAKRGKMSNIMQIQSLHPEAMRAHLDLYMAIMFDRSGLSREERELIAVVVSAANKCPYCIRHHAEALNHYWKDDDKIKQCIEDFQSLPLSDRQRTMLVYAHDLTTHPWSINEDYIVSMRKAGLTDEEILTVNLVTAYFNFVNRIAFGLGVELSEEEATGYKY